MIAALTGRGGRHRGILVGASLAWCVAATPSSAQDDMLTPENLATLRSVSAAKISPDGRQIAYSISVPRELLSDDDGPNRSQLHVVDAGSGESRAFVTSEEGAGRISWTPDGSGIAFTAKRSGDDHSALYVIPLAGGEAQRVLSLSDRGVGAYRFSPDGSLVSFLATAPKSEEREKQEKQGFKQEIYEEDWRTSDLWIGSPNSDDEPRQLDIDGHVYDAVWSPSGTRLAVSLAPTALVDDQYMKQRVWIVDATNGSVQLKIENPGKLGPVAWSPDESQLGLIAAADLHDGSAARLLLASTESGKLRNRLLGYDGDVHELRWDRAGITMRASRGVESMVLRIPAVGGGFETLIEAGGPALHSLSVSADGAHAAFVADTATHPGEVFHGDLGTGAVRRLTNSNPWLDGVRLGKQEVITYEARDGLEIEGILMRPRDEVEGQRVPLVVIVHGGPESHFSNGWLTSYGRPGQLLTARGYAAFYPNYRGSTGRGLDYIKKSLGDPAGKEFDDVVDGVDHLIEMGLVDKDKVGSTGGSYGGYATGWMATYYSDRFAAGVMFVGISNKISKVGTTDIPNEEFCVHALKRPWEDWNFFLERSPIYYAGQSKTPLLILHGKDDPRVDPGQSKELYRHLKLRSKAPVRLVLYPGEGHGNRKGAAKYDYSLRLLRWFDHYLMGEGGAPPAYDVDYSLLTNEESAAESSEAGSR